MALTDDAVQNAAQTLLTHLQKVGCQQAYDPLVQSFQQAYVNAGGSLPADTGGRSGIDGFYGDNTAQALQDVLDAGGIDVQAPAGCVGAAPSGGGGGGKGSSSSVTTTTTSSNASFLSSLSTPQKWGLGLAVALGLGYLAVEAGRHPMGKAPARARRGMQHHARRVMRHRRR